MKEISLCVVLAISALTENVHARKHSVRCLDEIDSEDMQPNITDGGLPCTAELWCPPQWNRTQKIPPKPRLHKLRYYTYKINGKNQRNIGLRIKWSNTASHYQNYIKGYSLAMFSINMMYDFRICFKTTNVKSQMESNEIEFLYWYKCKDEGCVQILPGKTYFLELAPNPMSVYKENEDGMHGRRKITIPGCDNERIRKYQGCPGNEKNRRKKARQNNIEMASDESTILTAVLDPETIYSGDGEEDTFSYTTTKKKHKGTDINKSYQVVTLVLTLSALAIFLMFILWIAVKRCNSKTVQTNQKEVLFLEKTNNMNSLHSLASQWLVSEIKSQGHVKVTYSKWEMLQLVESPMLWMNDKIGKADIIVLLFASTDTQTLPKSFRVLNDKPSSSKNMDNWLEKKFYEISAAKHQKRKFYQASFSDNNNISYQTATMKTYYLMEDLKEFYTAICGGQEYSLILDKTHKLYKLSETIKKSQNHVIHNEDSGIPNFTDLKNESSLIQNNGSGARRKTITIK
ncbi:uncharacterized protein LOC120344281 isoform X2 [Styela clava]